MQKVAIKMFAFFFQIPMEKCESKITKSGIITTGDEK